MPPKSRIWLDLDNVSRLYLDDKMTSSNIGKIYGVQGSLVCRALRESGVQMRHQAEYATPLQDRLMSYVEKTDTCWIWRGNTLKGGYGTIFEGSGSNAYLLVHRVSWEIHNGEIPNGILVLHKCDNRACVNPDHLFLGTYQDNMDDMKAKNRQAKGSGVARTTLTESVVKRIRRLRYEKHMTYEDIGKTCGVGKSAVAHVLSNRVWKWLK